MISVQTVLQAQSPGKFGKLVEIGWLSLPQPLGTGAVVAAATEYGSLVLLDSLQTVEQPSQRQRLAPYKGLLAGLLPGECQVLPQHSCLCCSRHCFWQIPDSSGKAVAHIPEHQGRQGMLLLLASSPIYSVWEAGFSSSGRALHDLFPRLPGAALEHHTCPNLSLKLGMLGNDCNEGICTSRFLQDS